MQLIDWLIVVLPLAFVLWIAFYSRRYVRGVVDYLAAGRLAGRYLLTVGDMAGAVGLMSLVGYVEGYNRSGFALGFWSISSIIVSTLLALTGFCTYRFRQTKALSNGQFLEMRYSRRFRIVASSIRVLAEMLANSIGPAIAARFFIYFLGIPNQVVIAGMAVPTFPLFVGISLILALAVILPGGRIALFITDGVQGLFLYPIFIVLVAYIVYTFSWNDHIVPVLADRVAGESFLNPFDIGNLRDFNLVMVVVAIIGWSYNRGSWLGNDSSIAGRTPHEQKMAGILGVWRFSIGMLMCILIGMAVVVGMNHASFAPKAHGIRQELSLKVASEVAGSEAELAVVAGNIRGIPEQVHTLGEDAPMSQKQNLETAYLDTARQGFGDTPHGKQLFQKFRSLYNQLMLPASFRRMLPTGLLGLFCLLGVFLMVTTDDSRIFNASTAVVQDLVLPLRKTAMTPEQHLRWVKWGTVGVAVFFFCSSVLFSQLDYITMFVTILMSLWMGAAAPIMVFGMYSRFGNAAGAWCALVFGSGTSLVGVLLQRNWAEAVYPFLESHGWVEPVGRFLAAFSRPLNPYVVWEMDAVKCPVNSYEFYFMAMVLGTLAYVAGSLLASRKPYNLDRLLHRGKYNTDGVEEARPAWNLKSIFSTLIGITPDYTRGDRIVAWGVFGYTFVYQLGLAFLLVVVWNAIDPWPTSWWSSYYFITYLVVTTIIGVVTAVWFTWGGIRDIFRLFKDLAKRVDNPLDDGRVEGHVSLVDKELMTDE